MANYFNLKPRQALYFGQASVYRDRLGHYNVTAKDKSDRFFKEPDAVKWLIDNSDEKTAKLIRAKMNEEFEMKNDGISEARAALLGTVVEAKAHTRMFVFSDQKSASALAGFLKKSGLEKGVRGQYVGPNKNFKGDFRVDVKMDLLPPSAVRLKADMYSKAKSLGVKEVLDSIAGEGGPKKVSENGDEISQARADLLDEKRGSELRGKKGKGSASEVAYSKAGGPSRSPGEKKQHKKAFNKAVRAGEKDDIKGRMDETFEFVYAQLNAEGE